MNRPLTWLLSFLCFGYLLPLSTSAQCPDQHDRHCWNLQYMLYAAQTDFRELQPREELGGLDLFPDYHRKARSSTLPSLDASFGGASVPCQVSAWLNGVAMYHCQGQASIADAKQWYGATLSDLMQLQYLWKFKVAARGEDHFVDAGPPDCEVAVLDGPYVADGPYSGECPLHLETVQQPNGLARIHLWLTSYTSPFLVARADAGPRSLQLRAAQSPVPPAGSNSPVVVAASSAASRPALALGPSSLPATAPSSSAPPASATLAVASGPAAAESSPASAPGCGELCRDMKRVLEDRTSAFRQLRAASNSGTFTRTTKAGPALPTGVVQLDGASSCSIKTTPSDAAGSAWRSAQISQVRLTPGNLKHKAAAGLQYVCYWPEDSASAAEARFHALSSLLEVLMPSTWSVHQENQADELSGAKITVWSAHDSADKPAIGLYLSGQSVGLHVAASN